MTFRTEIGEIDEVPRVSLRYCVGSNVLKQTLKNDANKLEINCY